MSCISSSKEERRAISAGPHDDPSPLSGITLEPMSQAMTYSSWENHMPATTNSYGVISSHQQHYQPASSGPPPPAVAAEHGGGSGSEAGDADSETAASSDPVCGGCRLRIVDKFFLYAIDMKWHSSCLKCSQCGVLLEQQMSFFRHEGKLFCKDDYAKIMNGKSPGTNNNSYERCSKCHTDIGPTDLVMKARQSLFHVECFRCARCGCLLKKGDLFGMPPGRDDAVYCQYHFYNQEGVEVGKHSPDFNAPTYQHHHHPFGGGEGYHHPQLPPPPPPPVKESEAAYDEGYPPHYPQPPHPMVPYGGYPHAPPKDEMGEGGWYGSNAEGIGPPEGHFFDAGSGSEEGKATAGGGGGDGGSKKKRGRKKRRLPPASSMDDDDGFGVGMGAWGDGSAAAAAAAAAAAGMDMGGGMGNKSKRARTSFKHNQLRIMRSHFQINQNPDSRELKMLSQKTGLDKKVLQVWFQNSRAKWRRSQSEGGSAPPPPATTASAAGTSDPGSGATSVPPPMTSPPEPPPHHPPTMEGGNHEHHHQHIHHPQQSFPPQERFKQL